MIPRIAIPGLAPGVGKLALGSGGFGSAISRDDTFAILDAYAEAGGNFIDTANIYASWLPGGKGKSEETIGAWMKARASRDRVVLATKGGHADFETKRKRLTPAELDHDLAESLDRLGTDRVDLYWFHRDDPKKPAADLLGWAARQIAAGRIGAIGCSNWTVARLAEAGAWAAAGTHRTGFCASQIGWSLADRPSPPAEYPDLVYMDSATYAYHAATAFPLVAYSSQANGYFSADKRGKNAPAAYDSPQNRARRLEADAIAARRGATPNQVALAWLWRHPFPVIPIVGPRTLSQLQDSLGALDLILTPAEAESLASRRTP